MLFLLLLYLVAVFFTVIVVGDVAEHSTMSWLCDLVVRMYTFFSDDLSLNLTEAYSTSVIMLFAMNKIDMWL